MPGWEGQDNSPPKEDESEADISPDFLIPLLGLRESSLLCPGSLLRFSLFLQASSLICCLSSRHL